MLRENGCNETGRTYIVMAAHTMDKVFIGRSDLPKRSRSDLKSCMVCGYSLRGLPNKYCCPECGFEYEDGMEIFYPSWRRQLGLMSITLPLLIAVWVYTGSVSVGGAIILGCGIWSSWSIWDTRRYRVVFCASGVRVAVPGSPHRLYEWDRLRGAAWSRATGAITLETDDDTEAFVLGERFFGSHRRSRMFVDALNRRLAANRNPVVENVAAG